jgi:ectoine hydroxylase-related dioxygenase (phytanoyl-CoA dioxygenase family)
MNARASKHARHFQEHGYAVIRGLFDPAEVRELSEAFDRVYRQGLCYGTSYRHQNTFFRLAPDPVIGTIVRMVQWPAYFDATLARYRTDTRIRDVLAPLLGENLKQIINQLHWKPPGATNVEFGFHQDIRSRRPRQAYRDPAGSYIQTGIAVDPHCRESGAMVVFPGSHRLGELGFEERQAVMDRPLDEDEIRGLGIDPGAGIELTLEPGDLALWHLYLIHGSGANRSAGDRRFYINGYVIAENCSRGEWAFRDGEPCPLGEPVLVHYEDLYTRPGPFYVD